MLRIPFRTDAYGRSFFIVLDKKETHIPFRTGEFSEHGISFSVVEEETNDILHLSIGVCAEKAIPVERFGFRLGIDTYMDTYPQWNHKFFPTALRCEKNGFWACFMSPEGKMLAVCSPSKIISWKNEYNTAGNDVGHRIYTSSIDFINIQKQPKRHPANTLQEIPAHSIHYDIYYHFVTSDDELRRFIERYAHIHIPTVNKFTLEPGEELVIDQAVYTDELKNGLNVFQKKDCAELAVYVRKDWFYYLDCAQKSAQKCQQKPGTHCESWYGYFTMAGYAKILRNEQYTKQLCTQFDAFFSTMTKGIRKKRLKKKALPYRLQNASAMISLLTDFYELTENEKYLNFADDLAAWLMKLQSRKDGSYRSHKTHYTCVIYPAKSMMELALAEQNAGRISRSKLHLNSAKKAVENLLQQMDDIATEGQMTFEDGMISCESLQLALFALITENPDEKKAFTQAAETIMRKHRCLEQRFLPDCRVRGCTLRFWEARYDINFFANMLNCPHGWTSWKNYASYYLYLLTGNFLYLKDLMDTLGACMQCVDADGELMWAYVADPCVSGQRLKKGCTKDHVSFEECTVGEEYLPMISDWFRHDANKLTFQYIRWLNAPATWSKDFGGSCDNDVHEHFKCLCETVFGKAFLHERDDGNFVCYNCRSSAYGFVSNDPYVSTLIIYAAKEGCIRFNQTNITISSGMNFFKFLNGGWQRINQSLL